MIQGALAGPQAFGEFSPGATFVVQGGFEHLSFELLDGLRV
jgi:hypothetical protein